RPSLFYDTSALTWVMLQVYRPDAHSVSPAPTSPLPPVCRQAAVLFFQYCFNSIDLKCLVCNYTFQTRIFFLQVFHPFNITVLHFTVLRLPVVKGRITDAMFPTNIFHRFAGRFLLLKNGDDLGLRKSFLFHI